jgi:DNA-binding HxlR family transcriptional regulator
MSAQPYGLICPITHACEVLEPRWTIPILTEMWNGTSKFNEIRRSVGNISPALLSKRLKELEHYGLIERVEDPATGQVDYLRTQAAIDMEPALDALAKWAQRNIKAQTALENINVSKLMFYMRHLIYPEHLPNRQVVIQIRFSDPGLKYDTYWIVTRPAAPVEVCSVIPGFDVDLYIETDRVSFSSMLLNRTTTARELDEGRLYMSGDALLIRTIDTWMYRRTKETADEILQLDLEIT